MSGVRPGDLIAGKFRVERVLGEGGMGYVVSAKHLQLGQMVALKFMREEICTAEYRSRFLREARNTVRLKSKHVSRVLDVGDLDGGAPYMVMEYLEGTDLSALLHSRGPFAAHEACEYVLQACEAIAEAHGHGIVHRDLKPANLFLTRGPGGEPVVKVLDFGVSKVIELAMEQTSPSERGDGFDSDSVVTKATDLLGSPSYMAPEQIVSARDADARSDIWSLGVILFRLMSGRAPFSAQALGELIQQIVHGPIPNLRDHRPDLPAGLEHVVARCLERDRSRRLADVAELARLLAPYAGPVATPSLERIAILGPALVTSAPRPPPPSLPPPNPSAQSGPSPSAWSSPPASTPPAMLAPVGPAEPAPRREMSATSAAALGLLFVLLVLASVGAFALRMTGGGLKAAGSASAMPATSPLPSEPPPPPSAPPDPPVATVIPAPGYEGVVVASPPSTSNVTVEPAPSVAPRTTPKPRPTSPRPTASDSSTTTAPGEDIPSTRE